MRNIDEQGRWIEDEGWRGISFDSRKTVRSFVADIFEEFVGH